MLALRRILPLLAMALTVINAQQKPQHALFFRTDADLGEVLAAEATQNDAFANGMKFRLKKKLIIITIIIFVRLIVIIITLTKPNRKSPQPAVFKPLHA